MYGMHSYYVAVVERAGGPLIVAAVQLARALDKTHSSWAPPLLITRSAQMRKGAGIASSLGSATLAMLAKGEGLQAWATPTSPRILRRMKASSMLIPHSPASSRAASRQASRMASGYSIAVPWAIHASCVSLTGHSPCLSL